MFFGPLAAPIPPERSLKTRSRPLVLLSFTTSILFATTATADTFTRTGISRGKSVGTSIPGGVCVEESVSFDTSVTLVSF